MAKSLSTFSHVAGLTPGVRVLGLVADKTDYKRPAGSSTTLCARVNQLAGEARLR